MRLRTAEGYLHFTAPLLWSEPSYNPFSGYIPLNKAGNRVLVHNKEGRTGGRAIWSFRDSPTSRGILRVQRRQEVVFPFPFQFLHQGWLRAAHKCRWEPRTVLFYPLSLVLLFVMVPCKSPVRRTSWVLSQPSARAGEGQFCGSHRGENETRYGQVTTCWLLPLGLEIGLLQNRSDLSLHISIYWHCYRNLFIYEEWLHHKIVLLYKGKERLSTLHHGRRNPG